MYEGVSVGAGVTFKWVASRWTLALGMEFVVCINVLQEPLSGRQYQWSEKLKGEERKQEGYIRQGSEHYALADWLSATLKEEGNGGV